MFDYTETLKTLKILSTPKKREKSSPRIKYAVRLTQDTIYSIQMMAFMEHRSICTIVELAIADALEKHHKNSAYGYFDYEDGIPLEPVGDENSA